MSHRGTVFIGRDHSEISVAVALSSRKLRIAWLLYKKFVNLSLGLNWRSIGFVLSSTVSHTYCCSGYLKG